MPHRWRRFILPMALLVALALAAAGCEGGRQQLEKEVAATLSARQTASATAARAPTETLAVSPAPASPVPPTLSPPLPTQTPLPTLTPTPAPAPYTVAGQPLPQPLAALTASNAGELRRLARWGKGSVLAADFSADGSTLALGSGHGVHLYDPRTLEELRYFPAPGPLLEVAFSPDGKRVAGACAAEFGLNQAFLWEVSGAEPARPLPQDEWLGVDTLRFAPDGDTLIGVDQHIPAALMFWDLEREDFHAQEEFTTEEIHAARLSPDGSKVLALLVNPAGPESLRVWDLQGRRLFQIENSYFSGAEFSPDGERVIVSGYEMGLALWQIEDGSQVAVLPPEELLPSGEQEAGDSGTPDVSALAFEPGGEAVVFVADGALRRWSWQSGETETLLGDLETVERIWLSPDGRTLLFRQTFGGALAWHPEQGGEPQALAGFDGRLLGLAFNADGSELVSFSASRQVVGRQALDGSEAWSFPLEETELRKWDFLLSPQASWLAIWQSAKWGLAPFPKEAQPGLTLVSLPEGGRSLIQTSPVGQGEAMPPLIQAAAFSPDETLLATAEFILGLRVWSLSEGKILALLESSMEEITRLRTLAFSPDGQWLAGSSEDGSVLLWSLPDGISQQPLGGQSGVAWQLAFSPDSSRLAASAEDGSIRVRDPATGEGLARLFLTEADLPESPFGMRVAGKVNGMTFSRDGKALFVLYWNCLAIWDTTTWQLLAVHPTSSSGLDSQMALSPDGTLLAWTAGDNVVEVWGVP